MNRLRVVANRPIVEDEHSPYADDPEQDVLSGLRVLIAVVFAVLLALAAGMIYRVLL